MPNSRSATFLAFVLVTGPGGIARAETLHDALRAAWALDPSTRSFDIDAHAAGRNARAAGSWFPSGPILSGQYLDDHFIGSNLGYTTYQGGVSVPLWLPGQGTATMRTALADETVARARIGVQRLQVAVRVLDLSAGATLTQRVLGNLQATADILARATRISGAAVQAGEFSTTDHEAIIAEREEIDGRIADQRQQLESSRAELAALTGADDVPDLLALGGHTLGHGDLVLDPARDPRIRMADAVSHSAQASYELARHSYMPNPQVGVTVLRQAQFGSPWDTQVGVQFQVPLPNAARNTPMLMREVRAVGAAERDAALARRQVQIEYRQTRARLASALVVLGHARATQDALDSRAAHLEQAWRVGETPVIEYLRAQRAALDASQRASQADVVWHASMVRMMLMSGNYP